MIQNMYKLVLTIVGLTVIVIFENDTLYKGFVMLLFLNLFIPQSFWDRIDGPKKRTTKGEGV